MLVLTRKYQEKIRIGDNIIVTVLRTKGKAVRLGIEAPADVPVIRGELAFAPAATVAAASAEPAEATANPIAASKGAMSPRPESQSTWPAESPRQAPRAKVLPTVDRVELKRIPRGKVADILPQLMEGSGPLRAMMDRR